MLAGVEILLERMKTNPEEFVDGGYSKWSRVLDRSWDILTEEEHKALKDAHTQAKREHFNGEVMRVLAGDEEEVTMDVERFYKGKQLMQNGAIVTSKSMLSQANSILSAEFDKQYARNAGMWNGEVPREIKKGKPHA